MNQIPLALNFNLGAALPLDSRQVISEYAQINTINPKYSGMLVYAVDTKKLYYLEDLSNNTWSQIGTGQGQGLLPQNIVFTTGDQIISGNKVFDSGSYVKFLRAFTNDPFLPNRNSINTWTTVFLNTGEPYETNLPNNTTTGVYIYFDFSGLETQLDRYIRTQYLRIRTGILPTSYVEVQPFTVNSTGIKLPYTQTASFVSQPIVSNLPLENRLNKIESSGAFCLLSGEKMGIGTYTPTEKLDVSGTIKTNTIRFGSPSEPVGPSLPPIDYGVIFNIDNNNPTGKFSITRGGFQQIPHGFGIVFEGGYINTKRGYLTVGSSPSPTSYNDATLVWTQRILSGQWKTNERLLINGTGVLLQGESSPDDIQKLLLFYNGPNVENLIPKTFLPNDKKNIKRYVTVSSAGVPFRIILPTGNIELGRTVYLKLDGRVENGYFTVSGIYPGVVDTVNRLDASREYTYYSEGWVKTNHFDNDYVDITSAQVITGPKSFTTRPTVNNTGVLLEGEILTALFNGNRQIKALPVLNTNYGGTTISGFLENMFFPYQNAIININDFTIYRYGVDLISAITFTGSYQRRDDTVTGIAYMNGNNIISGPTLVNNNNPSVDYGQAVSFAIPLNASTSTETYKTRIYITRNGVPATGDSVNKRVRFEPVYFYGVSNNPNLGLGISNLTNSNPSTYTYAFNSRPQSVTHSLQPNNQYIYFAYPSPDSTQEGIINWGNTLSSIYETTTNFEYIGLYTQLTPITMSFPFKQLKYRIYRSNDLITLAAGQSLNLRFTFGG